MKKEDINVEHLNEVYKDIAIRLSPEIAVAMHEAYQGIQVVFPKQLYSKEYITECMYADCCTEMKISDIARKYGYSERWVRKILKEFKSK